jgi:hypothetical protein
VACRLRAVEAGIGPDARIDTRDDGGGEVHDMHGLRPIVTLAIAAAPVLAGAQPRTDVYLTPLVSIQPSGQEPPRFGRPLALDRGISGTEPGLALGITHGTRRGGCWESSSAPRPR